MQEQITTQVKQELQYEVEMAKVAEERRKMDLAERKQDFEEDRAAFDVATKDTAEERRSDEDAYKEANKQAELDLKREEIDRKFDIEERRVEIEEKAASQAPKPSESKVTTVI